MRPRKKLHGVFGGQQCKSARTLEIIDLAHVAWRCAEIGRGNHVDKIDALFWFVKCGQSVERAPWGPSMLTSSTTPKVHYLPQGQVLFGRQIALLHGYLGDVDQDGLDEGVVRKLSGNAVSMPHLTISIMGFLCARLAPLAFFFRCFVSQTHGCVCDHTLLAIVPSCSSCCGSSIFGRKRCGCLVTPL